MAHWLECGGSNVVEPEPRFLAGARADLKLDLEPIFWAGSGSFFWQVKNEMILKCSVFIVCCTYFCIINSTC